jgi:hypothetical protein
MRLVCAIGKQMGLMAAASVTFLLIAEGFHWAEVLITRRRER